MLKLTFQPINSINNNNGNRWKPLFVFLALISFVLVASQNAKQRTDTLVDKSAIKNVITQHYFFENTVKEQKKEKQNKYLNDQNIQKQNKIFSLIKLEDQNAKFLLDRGFDYKEVTEEIHQLNDWEEFAVKGIVGEKIRVLTDRNLSSTAILLEELLNRVNNRLKNITIEKLEHSRTQEKIDSLVADKNLYYLPTDSVSRNNFRLQLLKMNTDINQVSGKLKNAVDSIQIVEILGDQLKYKIEQDIAENNKLRKSVANKSFTEKSPVFEPINIKAIMADNPLPISIKTNSLVLYFYLINNRNSILVMLILIIGTAVYFKLQKRKFLNLGYKSDVLTGITILNSPLATAVLLVLNLYQFILPMPPLMFSILIWTISTIALTVMMWHAINLFVWKIWIAIFILNLTALFDITILIHFPGESYLIMAINCLGIAIGIYAFYNRSIIQRKIYLWYIIIATILQIFSFYYLVNGSYNLGKFLMSKAVYTIVVVFSLYSAFVAAMEVGMVSKILAESDEDELKPTIDSIAHKFNAGFYLIIFVCWFVLMTRNTYTFQSIVDPLKNSIYEPRSIGDMTFTFENIITFILVILLSGFLSRVVTFLTSDRKIIGSTTKTKSIGSWVFLSRIAIVTIGIMVAFASAGFPFDKITLIISALGVGIGFGMQNLINNLISGLIIAFEKPVSLDDVIEVGGQSGKMKSIGIRSSVISTYDGADVIIPNGELLDKELTNWTLGSSSRRSEIKFGVAYGTDLELTQKLILEILTENENVLQKPEPGIWFAKFNEYAIDVEVKYWIGHFDMDEDVKSELIIAIDKTLKKNNIFIPFQQHDIHVTDKEATDEDTTDEAQESKTEE